MPNNLIWINAKGMYISHYKPRMSRNCVKLDVRPILKSGKDPFPNIMQALQKLKEDEDIEIIAPFEPVPLFRVMKNKGFDHEIESFEGKDFRIRFIRQLSSPQKEKIGVGGNEDKDQGSFRPKGYQTLTLDLRGLEPPEPMVRILKEATTLPSRFEMQAITDRRPVHLYALLAERGFTAITDPFENGSYLTRIRSRKP